MEYFYNNTLNKDTADKILLVGNSVTKSTFGKNYQDKLVSLNYSSYFDIFKTDQFMKNEKTIDFIHVSSYLDIRKGFLQLLRVWDRLSTENNSIIINIIGTPESLYWEDKIKDYQQTHNNLKYWGWIDSTDDKYKQIIETCKYAFITPIEEGQVGCLLDIISLGCIPIVTSCVGIDDEVLKHCYVVDINDTEKQIEIIKELSVKTHEKYLEEYSLLEKSYKKYHNKSMFFNTLNQHIKSLNPFQNIVGHVKGLFSIILTVFNKEFLIDQVLQGIFKYSNTVFELIIVIDGCTDNSLKIIEEFLNNNKSIYLAHHIITYTDDVFETRANNVGCKLASGEYIVIVQDDMIINENNWLQRLSTPFRKFTDVFAVTSQTAHNYDINTNSECKENKQVCEIDTYGEHKQSGWCSLLNYTDLADKNNTDRKTFSVRDSVNRGPLMILHSRLKTLGYFDEIYYPLSMDDHDLCYKAWLQYKWVSGVYWIDRISEPSWGSTRAENKDSLNILKAHHKNSEILMKRYFKNDYKHHNEDRECIYN